jgi:hypothetical protein
VFFASEMLIGRAPSALPNAYIHSENTMAADSRLPSANTSAIEVCGVAHWPGAWLVELARTQAFSGGPPTVPGSLTGSIVLRQQEHSSCARLRDRDELTTKKAWPITRLEGSSHAKQVTHAPIQRACAGDRFRLIPKTSSATRPK